MTDNALAIRNLQIRLRQFQLQNVGFEVKKGTIMGLVGKNGAGKTTLIKAVMDDIRPLAGEILFDGISLLGNEETVKNKTGIVYDSLIYPAGMQPAQITKMLAPLYISFDQPYWETLMQRFALDGRKRLFEYSKGMQMKFSLVMALAHHPDLLILDEPTAGIDPAARADMLDLLLELMQDGEKAILFSTHITSDLDKIADYITLLDNGRMLFSMEKDVLLDRYALAHFEEGALAEADRACLTGIRKTTFGYEALCSDRARFANKPGVRLARPNVEDILVYGGGSHAQNM